MQLNYEGRRSRKMASAPSADYTKSKNEAAPLGQLAPSVKDVARVAGVSTATVSRVVNCTTSVSSKTKVKVLKAISDLGYHPNLRSPDIASFHD